MKPYPNTPRHNAIAACLQFYGRVDPDTSRYLAVQIVETLDRIERAQKAHAEKVAT